MKNTIMDRTIPVPKLNMTWLIQPVDEEATEGAIDLVKAKTAAEAFLKSKFDHNKIKVRACPVKKGREGMFGLFRLKPLGPWVTPEEAMTEVAVCALP